MCLNHLPGVSSLGVFTILSSERLATNIRMTKDKIIDMETRCRMTGWIWFQRLMTFSFLRIKKKERTYRVAAISSLTCSRASKKNRSISVLCSKMFLANRLTLFISRVFKSTVLCSLLISTAEDSVWILAFSMREFLSASNSMTTWLKDFSRVSTFSCSWGIKMKNNAKWFDWHQHPH